MHNIPTSQSTVDGLAKSLAFFFFNPLAELVIRIGVGGHRGRPAIGIEAEKESAHCLKASWHFPCSEDMRMK